MLRRATAFRAVRVSELRGRRLMASPPDHVSRTNASTDGPDEASPFTVCKCLVCVDV